MTTRQLRPTEVDADCLADLIAEARAIPTAAFSRSRRSVRRVIDLTVIPAQRSMIRIPEAAASLMAAAEEHLAGYRR